MSDPFLDVVTYNKNALNNLRRAVVLGQGQFSLILARVNYEGLRRILITELSKYLAIEVVPLPPNATSLREAILQYQQTHKTALTLSQADSSLSIGTDEAESGESLARVLMLTGLADLSVAALPTRNGAAVSATPSPLEKLLKAANLGRDELPKHFPYPVVLWVNDTVLQQLNRYAPDLKSFAATPLRFEYPTQVLIAVLRDQAAKTFAQILDTDKGLVPHYRLPLSASITRPLVSRELAFALTQLENLPEDQADLVCNDLLADLLFLQGRNLHLQGDLLRAESYYEKSLLHWQQISTKNELTKNDPTKNASLQTITKDKEAILQFHLGLWWRAQADTVPEGLDSPTAVTSLRRARQYFESCLAIFRQQHRPERLARFILALAEVLQKLLLWPALAAIAKEGLNLHHNDPLRLARDYGYLAEVALARYKTDPHPDYISEAQGFAQQALEISEQVSWQRDEADEDAIASEMALRYHRGCYFFSLAITQELQGHTLDARSHFERALQQIDPHFDLVLYRQVLDRLWYLNFNHQHYAEAFEVKLEQRRIETLFGLRAFIGASKLQPLPVPTAYSGIVRTTDAQAERLATEIKASGRSQDIEALVNRLFQPRYPLVVMHGQSGVGKSSILRAGLMPKLRISTNEGRTIQPIFLDKYSDWTLQLARQLARMAADPWAGEGELGPENVTPISLSEKLRQLTQERYQQIVLIFDQFEDFFAEFSNFQERRGFYFFLRDCLDLPHVKVLLSLREDFLHYLLEWDRNADLSIVDNDILSKEIRYYLGNFSPKAAENLIEYLTKSAKFELEPGLITALVDELSEETGEVRPIELQVVGAQLQRENITTLAAYRQLGSSPKSQLLKNFLDSVVQDCGTENTSIARSVLYLLSEGETRPLKSLSELQEPLTIAHIESAPQQLSLVLDILIGSGLVFEVPEVSGPRYQLVHEYLAGLVQEQQKPGLIEVLQAERNRRQLTEEQLRKALAAQSDSWVQAALAKQKAKVAEIKALVSASRSLQLSGDGIEAMAKALRAAKQVEGTEDNLLRMQVALCLSESIRSIHERNALSGHRNWVLAVHCNPSLVGDAATQRIASASEDDTIKLWNGRGELVRSLPGHTAGVIDVRFCPDGEHLASASLDHTIRLWRSDGTFVRSLETATASVTSISFSPTEPLLAATYSDTTVRLWNLDGDCVRTLEGHEDWVRTVAFSPDGTILATGGEDNTVRLWSVDGELLDTLYGHRGWVRSVAFSPDGRKIISAGDANTLRLWSVDGYKLDIFYGHEDWVRSVAFSPDGRYIASASDDQTVRVWELDGTVRHTFNHRSSVHSVAWSADGRSLVSGGDDDQVHIWWLDGPVAPTAQG
ncbi:MAG: WD40 repeat domain-containing protein, partial [Cyanobacteria bacterium J06632_3]